jgi:hypothetical protein
MSMNIGTSLTGSEKQNDHGYNTLRFAGFLTYQFQYALLLKLEFHE